jgi:hypothetical protein
VPADDRDAVMVQDTIRVGGFDAGKPYDYASSDDEAMRSAMEFAIDVPAGASILEAHLILHAGPTQSPSTNGSLAIHVYDVGDAAPFTDGPGDLMTHHPTFAQSVPWAVKELWNEQEQVSTVELRLLVQAVVERPDYAPGNHIGFVIGPGDIDPGALYSWADFAAIGAASQLHLKYTVTTAVGNTPVPRPLALQQNQPNPFNPTTRIEFSLDTAGPARLEILDVRGRLVRVLANGSLTAGPHTLVWDGRDERGRAAASGVYVYRLRAGTLQAARRMTLVR